MAVVRFAIDKRARRGGSDAALASSIDIIVFIAGMTIWAMAFLLALDNLGVEIKPLLAGLGIGGIAVALAVQTVLGDLLASCRSRSTSLSSSAIRCRSTISTAPWSTSA